MTPIQLPFAKRVFDICASGIVFIILSPLIFLLLIFFYIEQIFIPSSRGPLLYSERRVSQDIPFRLYKIRIFKVRALLDAQGAGRVVHTKNSSATIEILRVQVCSFDRYTWMRFHNYSLYSSEI